MYISTSEILNTQIFRLHNILLGYLPTQIQIDIKTGFLMYKYNYLIFKQKKITTYLKAKKFLHTTRISSFNEVLIIFLKKSDAKIYRVATMISQKYSTFRDFTKKI